MGSGDEHADAGAGSGGGAPAPAAKKAEDPFYTSRFAGVCRDSRSPRWRALIDVDGKKVFIGTFFEEAEAARAVDAARRERGRADVNFPQPGTNEVLAGRKRSESGFKGVFKHGPRWRARICVDRKMCAPWSPLIGGPTPGVCGPRRLSMALYRCIAEMRCVMVVPHRESLGYFNTPKEAAEAWCACRVVIRIMGGTTRAMTLSKRSRVCTAC